MAKTRRNFYIDDELFEEFKRMASISGVTMTDVISWSIKEFNSIVRMSVSGLSAEELIDYSHYKLDRAKSQMRHLKGMNGKEK